MPLLQEAKLFAAKSDRSRERSLLSCLRAGDPRAIEAVFRIYYQPLCLFAQRYMVSVSLAESLVQDVFTALWVRRAELEFNTTLRSHLFRVTRQAALASLRSDVSGRRITPPGGVPVTHAMHVVGEVGEERMAEVVLPEHVTALDDAMAHLPERRRLVLELRWTHSLTYREIAEVVGASVQAVEMQLFRTLTAVRMAVGHPL